jgi:hypothetical protein
VCHYEVFHPDHVDIVNAGEIDPLTDVAERDRDPTAFLRQLQARSGDKWTGFKLMLSPPQMKEGYRQILANRNVLKILLDRPNRFYGYRSWKQSMESGQWRVERSEEVITFPLTFDKAEFFDYLALCESLLADAAARMTGQSFVHLTYEQVVQGSGLPLVLEALGLPMAKTVSAWKRMNLKAAMESFSNPEDARTTLEDIGRLGWLSELKGESIAADQEIDQVA